MAFKNLRDEIDTVLKHDPAARSGLEVVLCYPGFHAILFYRLAHWLWERGWLVLGRFCSHLGRLATGIEIHPGARIGAASGWRPDCWRRARVRATGWPT